MIIHCVKVICESNRSMVFICSSWFFKSMIWNMLKLKKTKKRKERKTGFPKERETGRERALSVPIRVPISCFNTIFSIVKYQFLIKNVMLPATLFWCKVSFAKAFGSQIYRSSWKSYFTTSFRFKNKMHYFSKNFN